MNPQGTILMPVRDGEVFLEQTLAAILADDLASFELVVVDDGSRDRTPAILDAWTRREDRLVVVRSPRSLGISAALNFGLGIARGEFIARHDADDFFIHDRIRRQLDVLQRDPGAVLVCGRHDFVTEDGRRIVTRGLAESPEVLSHILRFSNPIAHSSVLFRRKDVQALGGYDEAYMVSDYELWTRLARRGKVVALPSVCAGIRVHPGRMSIRLADRARFETLEIARRELTHALGREPSSSEADAVASVWRDEGRLCCFAAADAVFRLALERSPYAPDASFRRRIAELTAEHWMSAAARRVAAMDHRSALVCLRYAERWHPGGRTGTLTLAAWKLRLAAAHRLLPLRLAAGGGARRTAQSSSPR